MAPKDVVVQHMKDGYDNHLKTANYLFVAHGAGLIGCLSVLKDYNSVPQLKGIGLFIFLFGAGFLAGMLNYLSLIFARAVVMNSLLDGTEPNRPTAQFLTTPHFIGLIASIGTLAVAIFILIARFHSL
jgi:ascorbate-specific PTS system EIIC-type component UlaA